MKPVFYIMNTIIMLNKLYENPENIFQQNSPYGQCIRLNQFGQFICCSNQFPWLFEHKISKDMIGRISYDVGFSFYNRLSEDDWTDITELVEYMNGKNIVHSLDEFKE